MEKSGFYGKHRKKWGFPDNLGFMVNPGKKLGFPRYAQLGIFLQIVLIANTAQLKTFTLDDDENDQLLFLELGCSHPLSPL